MDIFGIGWLELVFILIIAVIVVGPRDLGKFGQQFGRFLNRMYKSESWRILNEASRTLRNLPNRLAREASLEDLDSIRDSIKDTGQLIQDEVKGLNHSLEAWTPPQVNTQVRQVQDDSAKPVVPSETRKEEDA